MIDPEALDLVTKKDAQKYQFLPISLDREKNRAIIAMTDPYDVVALDRLKQLLPKGCTVVPQVCPPAIITDLGPVLALHVGAGAVAVAVQLRAAER